MPRHVSEVRIRRPASDVWAFVTDLDRVPEWVWFTDRMLTVQGKGTGCQYTERGPLGKSSWRITKVVTGRMEVHEGRFGPGRVVLTNEVIPGKGSTRFRQTVDYLAFPRFRPLGWLVENTAMRAIMRFGMRRTTPVAKQMLET